MAHTYNTITVDSRSYVRVPQIRPVGDKEDQLTWNVINTSWDTWIELLGYGKVRWVDWYYGDAYTDSYNLLTKGDNTYSEVTK